MKKSNWTKEELEAIRKAVLDLYEKLGLLPDEDPIVYAFLTLLLAIDTESRLLNSP